MIYKIDEVLKYTTLPDFLEKVFLKISENVVVNILTKTHDDSRITTILLTKYNADVSQGICCSVPNNHFEKYLGITSFILVMV